MASLITASLANLERSVRAMADLVDDGLLVGIHLEGPWLSPQRCGAHDLSPLHDPCPEDAERLLARDGDRADGDSRAGAGGRNDAVRRVVRHRAVAAVGHTDASYAVTRAAVAAGARAGAHLLNAMRPVHHREPGPVVALLLESVFAELMADGVHLHPAVLRGAARPAGGDRVATGHQRHGRSGRSGRQSPAGRATTRGSATGSRAWRRPVRSRAAPRPWMAVLQHTVHVAGTSLLKASRTASRTAARMLGLQDTGALRPGCAADLVLLDAQLAVQQVMRRGRWLARSGRESTGRTCGHAVTRPHAPDGIAWARRPDTRGDIEERGLRMNGADWLTVFASFLGAGIGAALSYVGAQTATGQRERQGRREEWGRRFTAALGYFAERDGRARELGRVMLTRLAQSDLAGAEERTLADDLLSAEARHGIGGADVATLAAGTSLDQITFVEEDGHEHGDPGEEVEAAGDDDQPGDEQPPGGGRP